MKKNKKEAAKFRAKEVLLTIPIILEFSDYHEIDYIGDYFKQLNPKFKCEEVEFFDGKYHGIFYLSKNAEYKTLIKENKVLAKEWKDAEGFHDDCGCRF